MTLNFQTPLKTTGTADQLAECIINSHQSAKELASLLSDAPVQLGDCYGHVRGVHLEEGRIYFTLGLDRMKVYPGESQSADWCSFAVQDTEIRPLNPEKLVTFSFDFDEGLRVVPKPCGRVYTLCYPEFAEKGSRVETLFSFEVNVPVLTSSSGRPL